MSRLNRLAAILSASILLFSASGMATAQDSQDSQAPPECLAKFVGTWEAKNDATILRFTITWNDQMTYLKVSRTYLKNDKNLPAMQGYFCYDREAKKMHLFFITDTGFYEIGEEVKRDGDNFYFHMEFHNAANISEEFEGFSKMTVGERTITVASSLDLENWKDLTPPVTITRVK